MAMESIQIYVSAEMSRLLRDAYGEGKLSANIERVMRAHLSTPENEWTLRYTALKKEVKKLNAEFSDWSVELKAVPVEKKELV